MKLTDVIRKPVVSEKSMSQVDNNYYAFLVDRQASKNQIKQAVETVFKVKVTAVRTVITKKAPKRLANRRIVRSAPTKKAIVKLKKGEKLNIYES